MSHACRGRGQPNICRRNVAKKKTRNGKKLFNGVNITHTELYFSAKEWMQIGPQVQKVLNYCPKRKAKKGSFVEPQEKQGLLCIHTKQQPEILVRTTVNSFRGGNQRSYTSQYIRNG